MACAVRVETAVVVVVGVVDGGDGADDDAEDATDDVPSDHEDCVVNAVDEKKTDDARRASAEATKAADDVEYDAVEDAAIVAAAVAPDAHDVAASDNDSCFVIRDFHTQLDPDWSSCDAACDNTADSLDRCKSAHCILDDAYCWTSHAGS